MSTWVKECLRKQAEILQLVHQESEHKEVVELDVSITSENQTCLIHHVSTKHEIKV